MVIGIGGSFLGPMFAYEAIRFHRECHDAAGGRIVRFLANVDPTDFYMATEGLDFEETLFVINSKTFTTAETMLNARTVKSMLLKHYKSKFPEENEADIIKCHFAACSTNLDETSKFGIDSENVFGFWNWVGGRFSVCSCIGMLPLSIAFGWDSANKFLEGAHSIDLHYLNYADNPTKNIPLIMSLVAFYHVHICGYQARAILPYS